MQRSALPALLAAVLAAAVSARQLLHGQQQESPVAQVTGLLKELKANVEADGKAEAASYDKFSCWCKDTLAAKGSEISTARSRIEDFQGTVVRLKAQSATHGVEVKQVEKDIAANADSRREAAAMRERQAVSYQEERTEAEQCIAALEAAIQALSGAGTKKKGFLETFQEAQILSVAADVRGLLEMPAVSRVLAGPDLQAVRHFADSPEDFVRGGGAALSAAQVAANPFGDYAPRSGQIQGILKSLYDTFSSDLEKANAEEASKQKAFEELMATKQAEFAALKAALQGHSTDMAAKTKDLADTKVGLDATQEQLAADETFFAETKATCKQRASEWAERTRLRTEELSGLQRAIKILSSEEATRTFESATSSFLQLSSLEPGGARRGAAYDRLRATAAATRSVALAKVAVALRSGGHFDKIVQMIEGMIETLREEEGRDVEEKKWCEDAQQKSQWDMEDLGKAIQTAEAAMDRHGKTVQGLDVQLAELTAAVAATEKAVGELKDLRAKEHDEFLKAQRDDARAVELLDQAIALLSEFYKNKGHPLALEQRAHAAAAPGARPELGWEKEGGDYGGRRAEHDGVVAILAMIKEDLQREAENARKWDAEAQGSFQKDVAALRSTLEAQSRSLQQTKLEKAELESEVADLEELKAMTSSDLEAEKGNKQAVDAKCSWVTTHFNSRREKRKAEMDALISAKGFLAGVEG